MTERRETGRKTRPPKRARTSPPRAQSETGGPAQEGERIAKYLARAGVASRRACETLITQGKVSINGTRIDTPAVKVSGSETIRVGRRIIQAPEATRLWRYHKPAGLITTTQDPAGRRTIFDELPKALPRDITIGRLDLNTEGLLLLTNDGALARSLELPANGLKRQYRARAHGRVDPAGLQRLSRGIRVEEERFAPIQAELEQTLGANSWLRVTLGEGRKREVRRALEAVGLEVNRLIRTHYGPFELGDLQPGAVSEVAPEMLPQLLGTLMTEPRASCPQASRSDKQGRPAAKSRLHRHRR